MEKTGRNGVAAILMALFCAGSASAYEGDVHYGLTKWLALKASFNEEQASLLAEGAISHDLSAFSATKLVVRYACLGRDVVASQLVQENHFPGEGPVPGPSKDRKVDPGGVEARRNSDSQINLPTRLLNVSIERFGQGLHPLEDSWSHQGEPDATSLLTCKEELTWGHPKARGGYKSHNADLTYLYPDDARKMARATYGQICAYAAKVLGKPCKDKYDVHKSDVDEFIKAQTKAEKQAWFKKHDIKSKSFLRDINLPNGEGYTRSAEAATSEPRSDVRQLPNTEESQFMLGFFSGWLTQPHPFEVAKSMVEVKKFRQSFGAPPAFNSGNPEEVAALLRVWRDRDHGEAAPLIHSESPIDPRQLFEALNKFRDSSPEYKTIGEALLPLNEEGIPFVVDRLDPGGKTIVAAARLRHAPGDTVLVMAERISNQYKVTGIDSVVEH